jgi:hypothetical protein
MAFLGVSKKVLQNALPRGLSLLFQPMLKIAQLSPLPELHIG